MSNIWVRGDNVRRMSPGAGALTLLFSGGSTQLFHCRRTVAIGLDAPEQHSAGYPDGELGRD